MIINCLFLILISFLVLLLIRNNWVYNKRTSLNRFENNIHLIQQYIDYDEMMFRFWIWDIKKLKKRNKFNF